jgi:hypothetical protein
MNTGGSGHNAGFPVRNARENNETNRDKDRAPNQRFIAHKKF